MATATQLYLIHPEPGQLGRAISAFLDAKRAAGKSPATLDFYAYTLESYTRHAGAWPPTPGACQAWLLDLRRDHAVATVASYYRGLRAFLNWCVRAGHLTANPLAAMDPPREPEPEPRAVALDDLRALFGAMAARAARGDLVALRDCALFRLVYDCGLRVSEACTLRRRDLDLERQAVIVRKGKGSKYRECFFGCKTRAALGRWLDVFPGMEVLWPSLNWQHGIRALTRRGVHLALQRWCARAGVEPFRVHDLRHSYVTHALRRGIDAGQVSAQAGHSDVAFTLRVYGRVADEGRRASHLRLAPGDEV